MFAVVFLSCLALSTAQIWNGECGQGGLRKIVGGEEATPHSWPWQASLQQSSWWSSGHICGATLIHPQWLVTAAHCVDGSSTSDLKIILGKHRKDQTWTTEVEKTISRIIMHENYNGNGDGFPNDIALLKLSSPVSLSQYVQVACLPTSANQDWTARDTCFITGWGLTQGTGNDNVLNQLNIDVRTNAECTALWGSNYIRNTHICVGNGDTGACNGDSGGPLVCRTNGKWVLAGATSWGRVGCQTEGFPSVYTRISRFLSWMEQKVATN